MGTWGGEGGRLKPATPVKREFTGDDNKKEVLGSREISDVEPPGLHAVGFVGDGISAGSGKERPVQGMRSQNFHKYPVPNHPR